MTTTVERRIKFGTDGWRSILADGFTFERVELVTQAIAGYLRKLGAGDREVVVGYDTRFLAERFALLAAEVFLGNGFRVAITQGDAPTPVVAYAILHRRAAGAVMFTASHNPPEYQGIKFIPDYAGPATPEITRAIEEELSNLAVDGLRAADPAAVRRYPWQEGERAGLLQRFDPAPAYLTALRTVVDTTPLRGAGLRVVVDPMSGTGRNYLPQLLEEAGCRVEVIHGLVDPLFGGVTPEPTAKNLTFLAERVRETGADLGLATDGDADRFGVVDTGGQCLTANQVLPYLVEYLAVAGERGAIVRTVATTHLLDRIGARYGLETVETPVGFKYIARVMRERPVLLGGEESGGLSIGSHLPEKDGLLACLLVATARAHLGEPIHATLARIMAREGGAYSRRVDVHYPPGEKEAILGRLKPEVLDGLDGVRVTGRTEVDGVKLLLEDGSWVLVRPSGTEPLLRIYGEAADPRTLDRRLEAIRRVLAV